MHPSFDAPASAISQTVHGSFSVIKKLFRQHIKIQQERLAHILAQCHYDGLVISAGLPFTYFADDQDAPFKPTPHFAHWCPERSPHHLLHLRAGKQARLIFYSPNDFWYEAPNLVQAEWTDEFEVVRAEDMASRWQILGDLKRHAFIGAETKEAEDKDLACNPKDLLTMMDWYRSEKTPYELYYIEEANELGAKGHNAVREAFAQGASEMQAHLIYLKAVQCREEDLPYPSIIGLDEKSAILHYQGKRDKVGKSQVLLIDSGATASGYCSDITRTYARKTAPKTFQDLLGRMESLQQDLCNRVRVGVSFKDLHKQAHLEIGQILIDTGILTTSTAEEALNLGLTKLFFPHGLGHMLGIQTHDVGGLQANEKGDFLPPSVEFPRLRFQRPLRKNEVVTVEPGLYFIPMLLEQARHNGLRTHGNWSLIDQLIPFGGIRIEDNVVVEDNEGRNLTRAY